MSTASKTSTGRARSEKSEESWTDGENTFIDEDETPQDLYAKKRLLVIEMRVAYLAIIFPDRTMEGLHDQAQAEYEEYRAKSDDPEGVWMPASFQGETIRLQQAALEAGQERIRALTESAEKDQASITELCGELEAARDWIEDFSKGGKDQDTVVMKLKEALKGAREENRRLEVEDGRLKGIITTLEKRLKVKTERNRKGPQTPEEVFVEPLERAGVEQPDESPGDESTSEQASVKKPNEFSQERTASEGLSLKEEPALESQAAKQPEEIIVEIPTVIVTHSDESPEDVPEQQEEIAVEEATDKQSDESLGDDPACEKSAKQIGELAVEAFVVEQYEPRKDEPASRKSAGQAKEKTVKRRIFKQSNDALEESFPKGPTIEQTEKIGVVESIFKRSQESLETESKVKESAVDQLKEPVVEQSFLNNLDEALEQLALESLAAEETTVDNTEVLPISTGLTTTLKAEDTALIAENTMWKEDAMSTNDNISEENTASKKDTISSKDPRAEAGDADLIAAKHLELTPEEEDAIFEAEFKFEAAKQKDRGWWGDAKSNDANPELTNLQIGDLSMVENAWKVESTSSAGPAKQTAEVAAITAPDNSPRKDGGTEQSMQKDQGASTEDISPKKGEQKEADDKELSSAKKYRMSQEEEDAVFEAELRAEAAELKSLGWWDDGTSGEDADLKDQDIILNEGAVSSKDAISNEDTISNEDATLKEDAESNENTILDVKDVASNEERSENVTEEEDVMSIGGNEESKTEAAHLESAGSIGWWMEGPLLVQGSDRKWRILE